MDYKRSNKFNKPNDENKWCTWFKVIIIIFMVVEVFSIIKNIFLPSKIFSIKSLFYLILLRGYSLNEIIHFYGFKILMTILFILLSIGILIGEVGLWMQKPWGFYLLIIAFGISFILNIIYLFGARYWWGVIMGPISILEGFGLIYLVVSGIATTNRQNPFAQEISQLPIPSQFSKGIFPQSSTLPHCSNCGAILQSNQKFCTHCGHSRIIY